MYHFISGYTAKVAGTEMGVTEPQATFSPSGALGDVPTSPDPLFGIGAVTRCPDVPEEILTPRNTWQDQAQFDSAARKLADLFRDNFRTYEAGVSAEVRAAGPA